jgi:predicted nucleic acid-binding protein
MNGTPVLLDTNVLIYATNNAAPQHKSCSQVLSSAIAGEFEGVLVPQVLTEMLATLTGRYLQKPVKSAQAADYLDGLIERLPVLPVSLDSVMKLTALARATEVGGPAIYDLFLVAQMESHGVTRICTYDQGFSRLGVESLTPDQLLSVK